MSTHPPDGPANAPTEGGPSSDEAASSDDAFDDATSSPPLGSELEDGLHHLGNVLGGVATRLLGSSVTGRRVDERPSISPEADAIITDLGDNLGRLFQAAGRALESHPTDPGAALDAAARATSHPVSPGEGEAPLTAGLRSLGRGLAATSEAMLDRVAPRKPAGDEE